MKKTTIYLDPAVDGALARLAPEQGITKAELIRETLARAASAARRPRIRGIGVGSGPGDVAEDTGRHLAETRFGEV